MIRCPAMSPSDFSPPCFNLGFGILVGFAVHHGVFIHGEWHVQAPAILVIHSSSLLYIHLLSSFVGGTKLGIVCDALCWVSYGYMAGLMLSIFVYRVFFHRLTKAGFPGPPLARVSKLWHVWACRTSKNHQVLYDLHNKFGDFVRTGEFSDGASRRLSFPGTAS